MKTGMYYLPELNCVCVVYDVQRVKYTDYQQVKFSAATFVSDAFTTISHYTCRANVFNTLLKPIKITKQNYQKYLTIDNDIHATCVKREKIYDSKPHRISLEYGIKSIDRDSTVSKIRPRYKYLESENFGKETKEIDGRKFIVITTYIEVTD